MCCVARTVTRHVRHNDNVDACVVLRTSIHQLAAALDLHNCIVWTPVVVTPCGDLML